MNSLLTKLVLSGMATDQRLNFDLQEMLIPANESRTKIIYNWQIVSQSVEQFSGVELLCVVQDKNGERLHFVRDYIYRQTWDPDVSTFTNIGTGERSNHNFIFVTNSDVLFSWGSYESEAGQNLYDDRTVINEGFTTPLSLNGNANTARRSRVIAGKLYDYKPRQSYSDIDGFDNQNSLQALLYAAPNPPFFSHVVSYLDVAMSKKELQKWILNHG